MTSGGSCLLACAVISSIVAFMRLLAAGRHHVVPALERGSAIISGLPSLDLGDHAHAVRVVGDHHPVERRDSFTGWPVVEMTSSPRAKRSGFLAAPASRRPPASADHAVCTCSSPEIDARRDSAAGVGRVAGLLGTWRRRGDRAGSVSAVRRGRGLRGGATGERHRSRGGPDEELFMTSLVGMTVSRLAQLHGVYQIGEV